MFYFSNNTRAFSNGENNAFLNLARRDRCSGVLINFVSYSDRFEEVDVTGEDPLAREFIATEEPSVLFMYHDKSRRSILSYEDVITCSEKFMSNVLNGRDPEEALACDCARCGERITRSEQHTEPCGSHRIVCADKTVLLQTNTYILRG
jgi:hypothetical protein